MLRVCKENEHFIIETGHFNFNVLAPVLYVVVY